MEGLAITGRQFFLMLHLGLAAVFLHSFAGGLAGLGLSEKTKKAKKLLSGTWVMAVTAWLTVSTGTWVPYIWYRAKAPEGADVTAFPRSWLKAHPEYAGWHNFAMEWKEHVGWLSAFLATAVAFVAIKYGSAVLREKGVRRSLMTLFVLAFVIAIVAGGLGAFINKVAPNLFLQ